VTTVVYQFLKASFQGRLRLSDHRLLEVSRHLREDAAIQGGASHEQSVRLYQDDAL
jgi:hypothetical protein